jgi:DNA-3-methyladenine glycosylase II
VTERLIALTPPYRLDLTVAVLRRFSTNVVDVTDVDGTYRRAVAGFASPAELTVRVDCAPGDEERLFALVPRMLGTNRTVATFDRGAATIPWLRDLALRVRGVRPPRYATLWEACLNAIVFQQISLHAASAILRRVILETGESLVWNGIALYAFPTIPALIETDDARLRGAGLSVSKVQTLRRVGAALAEGTLDEVMLEECSSRDASAILCRVKGIGPWTAAVILLRGLGRLDVFPENDSGVARGFAALAGDAIDVPDVMDRLGDERGMLYYHLLLARLEARGEIATSATRQRL